MRGEQAEETALGRDMLHLHPAVATGLGATQPINKLNLRCCPVCLLAQGTCTASHREKLLPRTLQGRRLPLESAADPHLLFLQLCVWGGWSLCHFSCLLARSPLVQEAPHRGGGGWHRPGTSNKLSVSMCHPSPSLGKGKDRDIQGASQGCLPVASTEESLVREATDFSSFYQDLAWNQVPGRPPCRTPSALELGLSELSGRGL